MRRKFLMWSLIAVVVLGAVSAFAETDAKALSVIRDIQNGNPGKNEIKTLYVSGSATIGGSVTPAGGYVGNGASLTNLAGGNIASGNIALARVTNALATAAVVGNATTVLDGNGAGVTNVPLASASGASGTVAIDSTDEAGVAIAASALGAYQALEITTDATPAFTNVTLEAPGASLVGKQVHLWTASTSLVTIVKGTTVNAKANVELNEPYEGITLIGDTATKWLITNIHAP